jgi:hypothetical protein
MKTLKTLLCALVLALVLPATRGEASDYPPDYPICNVRDSVRTGPFEVIRDTTRLPGKQATLTVTYNGYLRNHFADSQIRLYVRLNGQDAMVQAAAGSNSNAYVYLNAGLRNCRKCVAYMASGWPECQAHLAAGNPEGQWLCQQPSALEQHIFYWAFDANLYQNAWDIFVAAEAGGQWDSNFGGNYYARLPPRSSYW